MKKQSNRIYLCLYSGLFCLGAFLRLYKLGYQSLWLDEAISYSRAIFSIPDIIRTSYYYDVHPPTYYLILHYFLKLGHSESIVRLFSAICGIAAIPVFHYYARLITDKKVSVIAMLFLSVSVFHIAYSQEARTYSLFFLCSIVSMLCWVHILSSGKRKYWLLWAGTFILNFHIHYFALILLGCQITVLLFYFILNQEKLPLQRYSILISLFIILLGSAPQLTIFFRQAGTKVNPDIEYWQVRNPIRFALILLKNTYYSITLNNGFLDRSLKYLLGFFLLTGLIPGYKRYRSAVILNGVLLILTAGVTWASSFFMVISGNFRYIIFINIFLTTLYAVAAIGWTDWIVAGLNRMSLFRGNGQPAAIQRRHCLILGLIVTAFLFLNGWILEQYYQKLRNEDWSEGIRTILSFYEPGDVIVPMPGYTDYTIRYYLRQPDLEDAFIRLDDCTVENMDLILGRHAKVFYIITNQLTQTNLRQPAEHWLQQHAEKLWSDRNWPKTQIWLAGNRNLRQTPLNP